MTSHSAANPLIVTLRLDAKSQNCFQDLRDKYFPADRNIVPAHISLFHALPPESLDVISGELSIAASREEFVMQVSAVLSIGRGVMYEIQSEELTAIQRNLAAKWKHWLIPQDQQRYKPHIVVQNKVQPETARQTFAVLNQTFQKFDVRAESIVLWKYLGGPWEEVREFRFAHQHEPRANS